MKVQNKLIPKNELWLYRDGNSEALDKAIEWAESNPRRENFDEIEGIVEGDGADSVCAI